MTKNLLLVTFVLFAAFTAWALFDVGYIGIFEGGMLTSGSQQIMIDLVIALGLFIVWMINDAKQRSINPIPWVAGILATGSLAALVYLIMRENKQSA